MSEKTDRTILIIWVAASISSMIAFRCLLNTHPTAATVFLVLGLSSALMPLFIQP